VVFLDLIFVLLLALSVVGGYRRGAVIQAFGLLGLAIGVALVALLAPVEASLEVGTTTRALMVVALVVGAAVGGTLLGHAAGVRVRRRVVPGGRSRLDSVLGAGVSVVALTLATWFLAVNLAQGPFPDLARSIRDSGVVRLMARVLPPPPALVGTLRASADRFGFDDAFVGLPPVPGSPVDDPPQADVDQAGRAGLASSIEVLGEGCIPDYYNQGSGFVLAPGYVVTNAHVVAGTHGQFLYDGDRYPARVVAIDRELDLAVLYAPTFHAVPLALAVEEVPRGGGGAVVGYIRGYNPRVASAAVMGVIDVSGRDIDGDGRVERRLYELQTEVFGGNSGGPFVLPDGRVAGVVFANSVLDEDVAYAIRATDLEPLAKRSVGLTGSVSTGACAATS